MPVAGRSKRSWRVCARPCLTDARCARFEQEVRDLLVAERERLIPLLAEVPYLSPLPSQANFILCRVSEGVDGGAVRDVLAQRYGIMIRHYTNPELRRFIRVSVGKPEQSDALLRALHELAGDSAIATRA